MDLDLKSLRLLIAACECGNIKHAAAQEHIEPSAISKRIAQLETQLGTRLLVRSRRGVRPTPAGEALVERARELQFTLDRIETDVAAFAGGVRGHVRLVASASAVAESLLDDIALFMRDPSNRGIQIDIEERLSIDVVRAVREGTASLGICWDSVDSAGLAKLPYHRDELALAVHPRHPLAGRKTLRFEESLDHEHVGLPPTTAVYGMLNRAAAAAGKPLSYRVVVSSFDAALRVVQANLGVSVIPWEVSRRLAEAGEVVAIRLADDWTRRRFAIHLRDASQLTAAASRLADFLVDQAAEPL